jgi:hypothetical protein
MSAIYILWLREVRRYTRSKVQIITSLGQPLLYLLAMGFGMGAVFRQAGRGSYLQFVAPGVIAMTVLFSATFSGLPCCGIASSVSSRRPWWRRYPASSSCWAERAGQRRWPCCRAVSWPSRA